MKIIYDLLAHKLIFIAKIPCSTTQSIPKLPHPPAKTRVTPRARPRTSDFPKMCKSFSGRIGTTMAISISATLKAPRTPSSSKVPRLWWRPVNKRDSFSCKGISGQPPQNNDQALSLYPPSWQLIGLLLPGDRRFSWVPLKFPSSFKCNNYFYEGAHSLRVGRKPICLHRNGLSHKIKKAQFWIGWKRGQKQKKDGTNELNWRFW